MDIITHLKTKRKSLYMLESYEHLLKMYEEGGMVDAVVGETLVLRGGKLLVRLAPGESFVYPYNDESRIPYLYWIV